MRILALIAAYNEERFIGDCLDHLAAHGVESFLCDNDSTDATVALARQRLGHGLRGIARIPRDGTFRWRAILERKEELAARLDADWFLHLDPDEFALPPPGHATLAQAIAAADAAGCTAVEFDELTFVPPREAPDHDHAAFRQTMRWYYPFAPAPQHRVIGWRRQPARVDLASSGGHRVAFPGRRIFPAHFLLCHYLFLSREHALRKYGGRTYDAQEVRTGWHGWRAAVTPELFHLPAQAELRHTVSDADLDASSPRALHCVAWDRRA
jgi:glycosyltransferase involved in cell wall biosynthesis